MRFVSFLQYAQMPQIGLLLGKKHEKTATREGSGHLAKK
jgi:hypothetical protein